MNRSLACTVALLAAIAVHAGCVVDVESNDPVVLLDEDAGSQGDVVGDDARGQDLTDPGSDAGSLDAGDRPDTRTTDSSDASSTDGGDDGGPACTEGRTRCDGECVDLASSDANCGTCGNTCSGERTCDAGSCGCPDGLTECEGTCVDTSTHGSHCGSCGTSCGGEATCEGGTCQCPDGRTSCGDGCVDTTTANDHCGGCNSPCASGEICTSGVCRDDTKRNRVIRQTNIVRSTPTQCESGQKPAAQPVSHNRYLKQAAQKHAEDMAQNGIFSHTGSDGSSPRQRVANTAYSGQYRAENIAAGNADAEATVQQWVNSDTGHCKGLMLGDVDQIGVGYVKNDDSMYTHYWVQNFGRQ